MKKKKDAEKKKRKDFIKQIALQKDIEDEIEKEIAEDEKKRKEMMK